MWQRRNYRHHPLRREEAKERNVEESSVEGQVSDAGQVMEGTTGEKEEEKKWEEKEEEGGRSDMAT